MDRTHDIRRDEPQDAPVPSVDDQLSVVAAAIKRRDEVHVAAQMRRAKRREAVFPKHRVNLDRGKKNRRPFVPIAISIAAGRRRIYRTIGTVKVRYGGVRARHPASCQHLSISTRGRNEQGGSGDRSCAKLHGRTAPVAPPDKASWRSRTLSNKVDLNFPGDFDRLTAQSRRPCSDFTADIATTRPA
jgi:hypothetical protein